MRAVKNTWTPLTHQTYRWMRAEGLSGSPRRLGLAVSGGADSLALLEVMADLAHPLNLEFHVLHVHHGPGAHEKIRTRSREIVRGRARGRGLRFHSATSKTELRSEAALRAFRLHCLRHWKDRLSLDFLVTAHHAQDLLETRLLRLLRGTGQQGLPALQRRQGIWLRPFLTLDPAELRRDLELRRVQWVEDPSNRDTRYLRNWIRHDWLPRLEARSPGARAAMARSLETLSEARADLPEDLWVTPGTLSRSRFATLTVAEQRTALAQLFHRVKKTGYTQFHIEEVRKRLDKCQIEHSFVVAGLQWNVCMQQISARLREGSSLALDPDREDGIGRSASGALE